MKILCPPTVFGSESQMKGDVNGFDGAIRIDELEPTSLRRRQRLQSTSRPGGGRGGGEGILSVSTENLVAGIQQTAPLVHVESTHARTLTF